MHHFIHQFITGQGGNIPQRRAVAFEPQDDGRFILPMKQSFMMNGRLMPSTKCMLALLAGFTGHGQSIRITQGRLAKHVGKSVRQVQRMLKDAVREGYLTYNYTKDRMGYITGIQIFLKTARIFKKKTPPAQQNKATTYTAHTNRNNYINKGNKAPNDAGIAKRLESLASAMGIDYNEMIKTPPPSA